MLGVAASSPFLNLWLKGKASRDLIQPALKKLETGSKPPLPIKSIEKMIPRPSLEKEIFSLFYPSDSDRETGFGIIIGPSGTGKTMIVREFCRRYPSGVLYYEVREPSFFADELAKEASIKTKPTNVFDLMLGHISDRYVHYLSLSSSPDSSVTNAAKVLNTLEEACVKYVEKHGVVPVLFIDGTDLIAKHNEKLFSSLITQAKVMADMNKLCIVFVSSEGSIMPLLKSAAGVNRATKIIEVNDIPDESAIEYLKKGGVTVSMANRLVNAFGGRFVYLRNSVLLLYCNKYMSLTEDQAFEELKNGIIGLNFEKQKCVVLEEQPYSGQILEKISKENFVSPSSFAASKNSQSFTKAINAMVNGNVLRYNKMGMLTWHSKLTKSYFGVYNSDV